MYMEFAMNQLNFQGKVYFNCSVADLLRGFYHPSQYRYLIFPYIIPRGLDVGIHTADFWTGVEG